MKVTIRHARMAGYCSSGMRAFAKRYGYSWTKFLKEGVSEEFLLSTKDAMALAIVEKMREDNGQR